MHNCNTIIKFPFLRNYPIMFFWQNFTIPEVNNFKKLYECKYLKIVFKTTKGM